MVKLIQVRIEDSLKAEADTLFDQLGLTTNDAIKIFLKKSVQFSGIPFPVSLNENHLSPEQIKSAITNLNALKNSTAESVTYDNKEDLFKSLGI